MMALADLKGIGKTRLDTLAAAGIHTMADLLLTLPVRYQDTSILTPLSEIAPGMEICVSGCEVVAASFCCHLSHEAVYCYGVDCVGSGLVVFCDICI